MDTIKPSEVVEGACEMTSKELESSSDSSESDMEEEELNEKILELKKRVSCDAYICICSFFLRV